MEKLEFVMMYGMFLLIVSNLASYYGQSSTFDELDSFEPPTLPDSSGWLGLAENIIWVISNLVWFIGLTSFSVEIFPLNILFIVLNIGMVWSILEMVRGN